jgi:hypothetical protein
MPEEYSRLTLPPHATIFMEQHTTLGVEIGNQDSVAKSLATLKSEVAEEKDS